MGKVSVRLCFLGLLAGAILGAAWSWECAAQDSFQMPGQPAYAPGGKPGLGESISSSIKQGLGKLTKAVTPKPEEEPVDDGVSLASEAKPGVELHVAVARLYQESGRLGDAAGHYQKALEVEPDNLAALLGYARLKDAMDDPEQARRLYLRAVKVHPRQASAHNNLALFCAGRGMFEESRAAFTRAVQLQPRNARYRNNFAGLLVKMGRTREAFAQLSAVHRPAVAHYNLGYLLEVEGHSEAAAQQYSMAVRADSSLSAAGYALKRVQRSSIQPQAPGVVPQSSARLSSRAAQPAGPAPRQNSSTTGQRPPADQLAPAWQPWRQGMERGQGRGQDLQPNEDAPLPPPSSGLMRLPPTSDGQTAPRQAPLPPDANRRRPTQAAPLPPQATSGPALQYLPETD